MITLSLLHPLHSTPIQTWIFADDESIIRIGRAPDNQVVLYSAVVSRHHVDVQQVDGSWEIVSLGANGTYLDDKPISQVPVVDGLTIRLAASGPKIQIRLESSCAIAGSDNSIAANSNPSGDQSS